MAEPNPIEPLEGTPARQIARAAREAAPAPSYTARDDKEADLSTPQTKSEQRARAEQEQRRQGAVILLLRSLIDLDYAAKTWSGQLSRQTIGGEGPSRRMKCASCDGRGLRRQRGIEIPCEICRGRGWLIVDSYTEREIGSEEGGLVRQRRAVRCDSCGGDGVHGNGRRCRNCGGSGWIEIRISRFAAGRSAGPLSPSERIDSIAQALDIGFGGAGSAFRQRSREGSYAELARALGALREESRAGYRIVARCYLLAEQEPEDLSGERRAMLDRGVARLAARMPQEIRVPAWAARNERRRRGRLRRSA